MMLDQAVANSTGAAHVPTQVLPAGRGQRDSDNKMHCAKMTDAEA